MGICTWRGLPDPPTPYLGLSPKKPIFWDLPLNIKQSFQLRKIDTLRSMHPAHFARWDQSGIILSKGAARQNRSYENQNLTHSELQPTISEYKSCSPLSVETVTVF